MQMQIETKYNMINLEQFEAIRAAVDLLNLNPSIGAIQGEGWSVMIVSEQPTIKEKKPENVVCPECGGEMVARSGQYGKFWGCKKYRNGRGTRDSEGRSKAERQAWKEQQQYNTEDSSSDTEVVRENNDTRYSFKRG